ncbi:MAG TPA: 1-(5-phosphoribosyl)-5-[(5-phosphoribosylamino)methylideneamino] imidazole-4-carboxamide isomerase [Longimicrobiales bacterium]|nr:1-(5-phosphoribosyl)-5-[(5-phosphoribosylamino)methylideneamino] imidazole-4-carboxamide isomerase [Longimicrobiales bacterium]
MIALAAIDVRGGRVVQLVGGRPEAERISLPDPAGVAREWIACGFAGLHVVDLDAALGTGSGDAAVRAVIDAAGDTPVQVGGGVRTTRRAAELLDAGAARVVAGTRAVEDPAWLARIADRWPGRVVVAADVRDGDVVIRGWTALTGCTPVALLERLNPLPLAGVLVTDVSREGRMEGADIPMFTRIVESARLPIHASGGIACAADLANLARAGAAAAVLGMSLYTGALDARATAREYSR